MRLPIRLTFDGASNVVELDDTALVTDVSPWLDAIEQKLLDSRAKYGDAPAHLSEIDRMLADVRLVAITGRARTSSTLWPEMASRIAIQPWEIDSAEAASAYVQALLARGQMTHSVPLVEFELMDQALRITMLGDQAFDEAARFAGRWVEVRGIDAA